jgi:hypothetical protein
MSDEPTKARKPGESFNQYFERRKREDRESNSTLQRRKQMSTDEKRQGAIEKMARDLKEGAYKGGVEVTHDEARRKALAIGEKVFKKHDR